MKKLKLKMQELNNPEVLTRQQLKNVLGGAYVPIITVICSPGCASPNGLGQGGTCKSTPFPPVGGLPGGATCECSVSKGTGCSQVIPPPPVA